MALQGTAIPRHARRSDFRPSASVSGRHRRIAGLDPAAVFTDHPVDFDTMLVWFVVLGALGLLGVVLSALS
jgi:hypothetical protein